MKHSIAALRADAVAGLRSVSDSAELDASLLLARALGKPRSYLIGHAEEIPDEDSRQQFRQLLDRRLTGEPIAYIEGSREFWSLEFCVTPDVLIPRPETEILVERALSIIPADADWRIADLGTGSGAIAISIATERPRCRVVATDCSAASLAIAEQNARRHDLANIQFRLGDWYEALEHGEHDLILSNPPYIAADDAHLQAPSMQFEPRGALIAEESGLASIRGLIRNAGRHLTSDGWLLLEHGAEQGPEVHALLRDSGFEHPQTDADLAGLPRVSYARLGNAMV